ncbi:TRAP transporter fused permease subunit [Pseudolabrys sp. FHR47]|uniref:TRAP transporter permease n=1 Tax=Pseudolabrys sp. FHR47 TaxID=2562284 RepID=UPI0010BEB882|nr:TRAP transporter fused permease subunit [Pseudolabrys sp. FHR47]
MDNSHDEMNVSQPMRAGWRALMDVRLWVGLVLVVFQYYILMHPQPPLVQRPIHLLLALLLVFLWRPLDLPTLPKWLTRGIDFIAIAGTIGFAVYYWLSLPRIEQRIENVDPVFFQDLFFGILFVALLIEGVRRTTGMILVWVILGFLAYGAFAYVLPVGGFRGFGLEEYVEILLLTTSGVLGVTTETSVTFVFYFIAFGVVYAAIGGGKLFIDLAIRMVGRATGGSQKVAVVGSSLMGTISGSAVANVAAVGVFTIPLMRKSGVEGNRAAATEAIASTGGQLMPPVMGVAAFVMAELIGIPYAQIALAGVIPAVAYYVALYMLVDLNARKTGTGTLPAEAVDNVDPVLPRLHLLLPPIVLIGCMMMGYSAQTSAMYATVSCFPVAFIRRQDWINPRQVLEMIRDTGRQAAEIAVPIGAIGIIIAIAIQSNLALKFSSGLISVGGGTLAGSLLLIIAGCIIMGMGLPTVAAYIIGAVLYAPALQKLGVPQLTAHFFVMYYCVLSMVTPPVALAAYAAAGIARTSAWTTGWIAFQMSFVAFLIPFAFVADSALLFQGPLAGVLIASLGLFIPTGLWAVGLTGYFRRDLTWPDRILLMICGVAAIIAPTGSALWLAGNGVGVVFLALNWRYPAVSFGSLMPGGAPQPRVSQPTSIEG